MAIALQVEFTNTLTKGLKEYNRKLGIEKNGSADYLAKKQVGIQLINFVVNGSSKESVVPPIKHGILRGSGSAFVGSDFVGDTKGMIGDGTPNKSYSGKPDTVTIGFNTAYATRMHETNWNPGPVSEQSGDTGNKYVERHLKADGKVLLGLYAQLVKRKTGA